MTIGKAGQVIQRRGNLDTVGIMLRLAEMRGFRYTGQRFKLADVERLCCGPTRIFDAVVDKNSIVHVLCAHCGRKLATMPVSQVVF